MRYDTVLFDADGTLLDFLKSEHEALSEALFELGAKPDDAMIRRYSEINDGLWRMLEKGEITKPQLMVRRFELLAEEYGLSIDPVTLGERYVKALSGKGYCIAGAHELCRRLYGKVRMYIVTNGTEWIQRGRWAVSGLDGYFDGLFISDLVGYTKPDVRFFEAVEREIPQFCRERTLIVGDSLSSDMKGGINFGIDTCWFCPGEKQAPEEIASRLTYRIGTLEELPALLELVEKECDG